MKMSDYLVFFQMLTIMDPKMAELLQSDLLIKNLDQRNILKKENTFNCVCINTVVLV